VIPKFDPKIQTRMKTDIYRNNEKKNTNPKLQIERVLLLFYLYLIEVAEEV
jgi:hypothetical protein